MIEAMFLGAIGIATLLGITFVFDDDDDRHATTSQKGIRIDGDDGFETLSGTDLNDRVFGHGGPDTLIGEDGDDRMYGGDGTDVVIGGTGDDLLRGGDDLDVLFGQDGNDDLRGDLGQDWLEGGEGDDQLTGGFGNDVLGGGEGADVIDGGAGDDMLFGSNSLGFEVSERQIINLRHEFDNGLRMFSPDDATPQSGGPKADDETPDFLVGGEGDDMLVAGAGDTATGGEGMDVFVLVNDADTGLSVITDYEDGSDSLIYFYDESEDAPQLELEDNSDGSQTLMANGEVLATIEQAGLSLSDVVLMPRNLTA